MTEQTANMLQDRAKSTTPAQLVSPQDSEPERLCDSLAAMMERMRNTPIPTEWRDDREFEEAWSRMRPEQKHTHDGMYLEKMTDKSIRRELAALNADSAEELFKQVDERKAAWKANIAIGRDSEWIERTKHLRLVAHGRAVAFDRVKSLIAQVGERYQQCTIDNFVLSTEPTILAVQRPVVDAMRKFADNMVDGIEAGTGLFLFGPVGSGKDHLLTAAMFRAIKCGLWVKWFNGMDLYGSFRDAMEEDTSESKQVSRLVSPDVLALSDPIPPAGEVTAFQRSMLFRVVDRRYRERKPTWVTMNVSSRAEADQRFGPQLVDRLADGALRLNCNWPSYRANRKWE